MGFPRQEYWSGLPFTIPGDLPDPGLEPESLALTGRFFVTVPPGKPMVNHYVDCMFMSPQNPYVEALIPSVMVIGCGTFGRGLSLDEVMMVKLP